MARRARRKAGAGAIILRILVVIVLSAAVGIGSFAGSKAFFLNRFKKDKKDKIAEALKAESQERVDVSLVRVKDALSIRIYHNKDKQMVFVPIRKDTILTLDNDGVKAMGGDTKTATVEQLAAKAKDIKVIKAQVEKTLGITIGSYESLSQKNFTKAVNNAGEVELDLENEVAYKDQNKMLVHIPAGNNTINGNQALGMILDSSQFSDENEHIALVGELTVKIAQSINKKSLNDYKKFAKDYYGSYAKSNVSYDSIKDNLSRMHEVSAKDVTYQILSGIQRRRKRCLMNSSQKTGKFRNHPAQRNLQRRKKQQRKRKKRQKCLPRESLLRFRIPRGSAAVREAGKTSVRETDSRLEALRRTGREH